MNEILYTCCMCICVCLAGFCDFEMDFCSWVNNPPAESGVDWDWLSGESPGNLIPDRDHSTNSVLGKLVLLYFN